MYKIITKNNKPIEHKDVLPLKLILHPTLKPEDIKLIAYVIDEYHHNPRGRFQDLIFKNVTGITRRELTNAMYHLHRLEIISEYFEEMENESGKKVNERVIELDYSRLLEVAEIKINVVKAGTGKRAVQHRKIKSTSLSKVAMKNGK